MNSEAMNLREFIGYVWREDPEDRAGVLVLAADVTQAAEVVRETYGADFHVSLWNEEDAEKPR